MDPVWITIAFILGFAVRQIGLPPLVGFLAAGFVLNAAGAEGGAVLEEVADLGVMLLLFTIGLKLRLRTLIRPEVWAGTSLHMLLTVLIFGAAILGLAAAGFSIFEGLDWKLAILVAFALSFSSTVFAIKILEDKGETASLHGRVSIGILVMQDVIAVAFITASSGKMPSPWALALVGLLVLRPALFWLLSRSGHGEVLILFGFTVPLVAAAGFETVGLKPDLGALILGVILAGHPKASELAGTMLGFKDLFLVGFFLSIGLSGTPSLEIVGIACLFSAVAVIKLALYFLILTRFRLRARTSLLVAFCLAPYSEFGLIVGGVAVSAGWIGPEWLVVIAVALSITFFLASPLNSAAHAIYARHCERLRKYETRERLPEDRPYVIGVEEIVVFGMGRVGEAAYDTLRDRYGKVTKGLDSDSKEVQRHLGEGRDVICADATDPDFWETLQPSRKVRLVLLAMPSHKENLLVVRQLKSFGYPGMIAAAARHDDEVEALRKAGADAAFNIHAEAGAGFADHACRVLEAKRKANA